MSDRYLQYSLDRFSEYSVSIFSVITHIFYLEATSKETLHYRFRPLVFSRGTHCNIILGIYFPPFVLCFDPMLLLCQSLLYWFPCSLHPSVVISRLTLSYLGFLQLRYKKSIFVSDMPAVISEDSAVTRIIPRLCKKKLWTDFILL